MQTVEEATCDIDSNVQQVARIEPCKLRGRCVDELGGSVAGIRNAAGGLAAGTMRSKPGGPRSAPNFLNIAHTEFLLLPLSQRQIQICSMPSKDIDNACVDCRSTGAQVEVRRRWLCNECFVKYVSSKVLKRMESYRFKNNLSGQTRKLVLPLSTGVSSVSLLHILNAQLQRQVASRGRTAYGLRVLMIDIPGSDRQALLSNARDKYREVFPEQSFACLPLSSVFTLDANIIPALKMLKFSLEDQIDDDEQLTRLFSQVKTASSRTDLLQILLRRLTVAYAQCENCEAIIWGDSDTRLAARALSEVAKGRGGGIPALIGDGISDGDIAFNYPLRDLYKTELETYSEVVFDKTLRAQLIQSDDLKTPSNTSIRNTSIDELLTFYINSQGRKYPSIMANVVKTTGKLQRTGPGSDSAQCAMCSIQLDLGTSDSKSTDGVHAQGDSICYACHRIGT